MIGNVRLSKSSNANVTGRHGNVPPFFGSTKASHPSIALVVTLMALLAPAHLLTSPAMIAATCATLLIGGLPHGALDLAILRRGAGRQTALVVSLYLILAAVMLAAWMVTPTLALALFLGMAIIHFAEDWSETEHPFFAIGVAASLISAPAIFHHQVLGELFVLLTGKPDAARLADALLLVAPLTAACTLVAIFLLWNGGYRATAWNAGVAFMAMAALPPITGFAIYFCLVHSPVHLRAGLTRLRPERGTAQLTFVATLGGIAIALAAFQFLPGISPSSRVFAASFMTLSILTLPHMAIPFFTRQSGLFAPFLHQPIHS
ncbi:MAG: Brp/Blh family beta-carotene 15,15'-dioxygenase [Sphingomicrobium sp.]